MEEIRPRKGAKDYKELNRVWPKLANVYQRIALGNGTALNIGMFWLESSIGNPTPKTLFVGVEGFGAYTFDGPIVWTYLAEKIKGLMEWDYRNLADFLNVQLERGIIVQGRYPYD